VESISTFVNAVGHSDHKARCLDFEIHYAWQPALHSNLMWSTNCRASVPQWLLCAVPNTELNRTPLGGLVCGTNSNWPKSADSSWQHLSYSQCLPLEPLFVISWVTTQ